MSGNRRSGKNNKKKERGNEEKLKKADEDLKKAKEVAEQTVQNEPALLDTKPVQVFVDSLGSSEVNLGIRFYVKTEDYWNAKFRVTENLKLNFDENEIGIPYMQVDVHTK